MKLLSDATRKKFRELTEHEVQDQELHIKTKIRPDGVDYTTMELCTRYSDGNLGRPNYSLYRLPERFFEKRRIKDTLYHFPLTDSNVTLLWHIWPSDCIDQIKTDSLSKSRIYKALDITEKQEKNAKLIAEYKSTGRLPYIIGNNEHREGKFPLIDFQKVPRHCAVGNGLDDSSSLALFMEQGTGKTATAISAVVNHCLKNSVEFARVLIVCPKSVRTNWEEEIEKFVPKDMLHRTTIVRGTKIGREVALLQAIARSPANERISFVIASYGGLRQTEDAICLKKLAGLDLHNSLKWDWAILDESHYIKSPKAKRTKSAHELRNASKNRLVLTGTPYVNSLFDLWAQWEFLGKYTSGFSNFNAFREFHAKYDQDAKSKRRKLVDFENVPLLKERLARTSFVISKEEALPDLPERVYDTVECEMSIEQINFYNKVRDQIFLEIENDNNPDLPKEMTVNNILTKLLRLSQVTAGFKVYDKQYTDDGELVETSGQIDRFDPNLKLDMLVEIIKEDLGLTGMVNDLKTDIAKKFGNEYGKSSKSIPTTNSKIIVWSCWIPSIKQIRARLELEGIGCVTYHGGMKDDARDSAKNSFNQDSACRVFIGNPDAGGVGLNLLGYDPNDPDKYLTNCDHMIYYAQRWSLAARLQSAARAHRKGTRVPIRITDLVVPNSIDVEIKHRLDDKENVAVDLTDIKEILGRLHQPIVVD